jgi:hypothetical protein
MPSIFELIRTSCAEVVSPLVEVDEDAAARFAKALDLKEVLDATKSVPGCRFPVGVCCFRQVSYTNLLNAL